MNEWNQKRRRKRHCICVVSFFLMASVTGFTEVQIHNGPWNRMWNKTLTLRLSWVVLSLSLTLIHLLKPHSLLQSANIKWPALKRPSLLLLYKGLYYFPWSDRGRVTLGNTHNVDLSKCNPGLCKGQTGEHTLYSTVKQSRVNFTPFFPAQ